MRGFLGDPGERKDIISSYGTAAENPAGAAAPDQAQVQENPQAKISAQKIRVLSGLRIRLTGINTVKHYPQELRLVSAEVEVKKKMIPMTFITNNFTWSPYTVCEPYLARWGVEVFFKEIKQNLQLADFLGYNENAIRWQFWTALLVYLLL